MASIIEIRNLQLKKDLEALLQSYDEEDFSVESIEIRESKMNLEVDHMSLKEQIDSLRAYERDPAFNTADIHIKRDAFARIKGFKNFRQMVKQNTILKAKIEYEQFIAQGGAKKISQILEQSE